jgi:hypothetical protein
MNLHEEIARVAYELYKKSGCIEGRDAVNWLDAERIVLTRHASQDIEEPEGEILSYEEKGIVEEVEGTGLEYAGQKIKEDTTVIEEIEVQAPPLGTKEDIAIKAEKIRPAKKAAAKEKKVPPKKISQKSRKKSH